MSNGSCISLRLAETQAELDCIEQLMQLYMYELSLWYPLAVQFDGRFKLQPKAEYFARSAVHPYLLYMDSELIGFAVVDDELLDARYDYSLGYFFILRRYQGRGLGVAVLAELFKRYAGRWEIYYLRENQPAAAFWPKALSRVGTKDMQVSSEVIHDEVCVMYRFEIQEQCS